MNGRPRSVVLILLAILGVLCWCMLFAVQVALAWGFRGEEKPIWFVVMSFAVYGAPVAVLVGLVSAAFLRWRA